MHLLFLVLACFVTQTPFYYTAFLSALALPTCKSLTGNDVELAHIQLDGQSACDAASAPA